VLLTDSAFLFLFLPLLFLFYFPLATVAAPDWWASGPTSLRKANLVLLAAGIAFVARGAGVLLWIPLGLVAINCWTSLVLYRTLVWREVEVLSPEAASGRLQVPRLRPSTVLVLGVIANVLALVLVRLRFFGSGAGVLALAISRQPVLSERAFVAITVSIVALHGVSYLVDLYRGDAGLQDGVAGSALYLLLFPFLLAGPILSYRDVEDDLRHRSAALGGFAFGVRRFVIGLCMKLLVADTLAITADAMFGLPASQLTTIRAWLGVSCYALQIYFALSGYSEMAIGLGRMLGFRLPENFTWPYLADSLEGFWREWNTSLSSWVRDYLYKPVAGTRGPLAAYGTFVGICLLLGLWYGAARTFVAWAGYHAAFLTLERLGLGGLIKRLPAPLRHAYVLIVVMFGWVLFRADTLPAAWHYWKVMVGLNVVAVIPGFLLERDLTPALILALIAGLVGVAPLTSMVGRWRVAIDAATISAIGLLFTTALFTWRLLLNLRTWVFDLDIRK
jgi:alginate O-acetyltransferase complex protein AlgI